MERMSPQDASFLHIESETVPMHIASCLVFEGPPPEKEAFRRHVAGKLPLVPRYRQRVRFVPLDLGRPVWVDDEHFNLDYHIRFTALPAPGGTAELRSLMGRVVSQHLDRGRPLWEMWVVEGLEDGRWAILSKVHHCMVDGVSSVDLMSTLFDATPEPSPPVADDWRPESPPNDARVLVDAVTERVTQPYEQLRGLRAATRAPRELAGHALTAVRGTTTFTRLARPTPETSLTGPIGPHRRWSWARTSLADIKAIRTAFGGTVNDVILATITRGFRDLLLHRNEDVSQVQIRTLVPVSVRRPTESGGVYNNRVSAMFAELPVGIEDPVERLHSITAQLKDLKQSGQAVAGEVLTSLSGFAPPTLLAMGTRMAARMPQRNVTTVTTNVPGPQTVLYCCGRRLLEFFPFVPISQGVRVGVAIVSYDGALNVGATGDFDTVPDLEVLTNGVEEGAAELTKLVSAAG